MPVEMFKLERRDPCPFCGHSPKDTSADTTIAVQAVQNLQAECDRLKGELDLAREEIANYERLESVLDQGASNANRPS